MAITENDIKLLKSINMTNEQNGGGVATNQVIVDNVSNAIFPDVTQQKLTLSGVEDRKVFYAVQSQNAEPVLAAMAFFTKIPKNENTTMNLYRSESFFDTRADRVIKTKGTDITNPMPFRLNNNAFNSSYASEYNIKSDKYLSCFVASGTITAGATQITVVGIDGILTTDNYTTATTQENVTAYGVNALTKILQNNFIFTSSTHTETIKVKSVQITSYVDSFSGSGSTISSYANDIESKKPYKTYVATLTLTAPLAYSYSTATAGTSLTWLSSGVTLLTVGGALEKFYTAKPLKTAIASGDNFFVTTENVNSVIPIVDGVTPDPEILGIDPAGFSADGNYTAFNNSDMVMILNEIDTVGTYASGQTVNLSRPNLAKIVMRDKNGTLISSSKYTTDLKAGTVKILDLTGVTQPITITDRIEDLCLIKSNTGTTTTETITENVVTISQATQTVTASTLNTVVSLTHAADMLDAGVSASIVVMKQGAEYINAKQNITFTSVADVMPTNFNGSNIIKMDSFVAKGLVDTTTELPTPRTQVFDSFSALNSIIRWHYDVIDLVSTVITTLFPVQTTQTLTTTISENIFTTNSALLEAGTNYVLRVKGHNKTLVLDTDYHFVSTRVVRALTRYVNITDTVQAKSTAGTIILLGSTSMNQSSVIVKDGTTLLVKNTDYTINSSTGFITLLHSADYSKILTITYEFSYDLSNSYAIEYDYDKSVTNYERTTLELNKDYGVSTAGFYFTSARCLTAKGFIVSYNELRKLTTSALTILVKDVDYSVNDVTGFGILKPSLLNKSISISYDYTPIALSATVTKLVQGTDFTIESKAGLRFLTEQCLSTNIDVDYSYQVTTPTSKTITHTTSNITLNRKLSRAYPVEGTLVANCMSFGTLQASVTTPFDIESWDNIFADTLSGSPAPAQFNYANHPIVVLNRDAIEERWAIVFVTADTVDVIGEHTGVILSNAPISANIAPLNPATAQPYFTLPSVGFGGNWSAGNAIRFNTKSATAPFWVMQSIKSGESTNDDFNFAIELRAEVDTVA